MSTRVKVTATIQVSLSLTLEVNPPNKYQDEEMVAKQYVAAAVKAGIPLHWAHDGDLVPSKDLEPHNLETEVLPEPGLKTDFQTDALRPASKQALNPPSHF